MQKLIAKLPIGGPHTISEKGCAGWLPRSPPLLSAPDYVGNDLRTYLSLIVVENCNDLRTYLSLIVVENCYFLTVVENCYFLKLRWYNEQRNTIRQNKLNGLILKSIKHELLCEIETTNHKQIRYGKILKIPS